MDVLSSMTVEVMHVMSLSAEVTVDTPRGGRKTRTGRVARSV